MEKRSPTTKDIGLLQQLFSNGQLTLASEFQRNSVWPNAAKAYLIDTILNDRPIPLLFFQRTTSAQRGLPAYTVIDGQQRLRAIFEFLDDRYKLTESKNTRYAQKRFSELRQEFRDRITNYDLVIEELSGYSESDIRDMFVRFNRYVVQLSPQEMRHAKGSGRFHDFVENLGRLSFWREQRVFSKRMINRMRSVEFAAELTILLIEGPQDKKASIDLYYGRYKQKFADGRKVEKTLEKYLTWIVKALPHLSSSRFRKAVDLYALIGALHRLSSDGNRLSKINPRMAGPRLSEFEKRAQHKEPTGDAARYVVAASRQTDNLTPRTTRIEILENILRES
jgi:Protein of unknown function DUF262